MEKYELIKKIGEGTYGIVSIARHIETGMYVAIKKFKESDDNDHVRKTALQEIRILKQLKHDHIVNLIEVFRDNGRIFLVFEQLNRTILEELEGNGENGAGIEEIEKAMHRDFKPENMLLSKNGVLKICDFGFARTTIKPENKQFTNYVATRWYRAPELLVGDLYGKPVDIWAIGCIFVELLTGAPLFTGETDYMTLKQILTTFHGSEELSEKQKSAFFRNKNFKGGDIPMPEELDMEEQIEAKLGFLQNNLVIAFARECLRLDPEQRPTAEELMNHSYFDNFREEFEDELQTLIEFDNQELYPQHGKTTIFGNLAKPQPLLQSNANHMSRQNLINYQQHSDYEEAKISSRVNQPISGNNSFINNTSSKLQTTNNNLNNLGGLSYFGQSNIIQEESHNDVALSFSNNTNTGTIIGNNSGGSPIFGKNIHNNNQHSSQSPQHYNNTNIENTNTINNKNFSNNSLVQQPAPQAFNKQQTINKINISFMGESSLTNLHSQTSQNQNGSPSNDVQMLSNFNNANAQINQFKNNSSNIIAKRAQNHLHGNQNDKSLVGLQYQQQQQQQNQMDYSYGSIVNNNLSSNIYNNNSNNSQIGAKGGGFFPNLRAFIFNKFIPHIELKIVTKQRESNLAQNGQNTLHKNNGLTRMIALPQLNDSNILQDEPSQSYFHTSSNQQLIPSTSSYQFSLQAVGQGFSSSIIEQKQTQNINSTSHTHNSNLLSKKHHTNKLGMLNNNSLLPNLIVNTNKENVVSGPLPQPHVKIIDLQHNLLPFDLSNNNTSSNEAIGQSNSGSAITGSNFGVNAARNIIDTQALRNQIKQQRAGLGNNNKDLIHMSQHQQYLLQQMHSHNSYNNNKHPHGISSSGAGMHNYYNHSSSNNGKHTSGMGTAQAQPKTPNDIYGFAQKAILNFNSLMQCYFYYIKQPYQYKINCLQILIKEVYILYLIKVQAQVVLLARPLVYKEITIKFKCDTIILSFYDYQQQQICFQFFPINYMPPPIIKYIPINSNIIISEIAINQGTQPLIWVVELLIPNLKTQTLASVLINKVYIIQIIVICKIRKYTQLANNLSKQFKLIGKQ